LIDTNYFSFLEKNENAQNYFDSDDAKKWLSMKN
jgi:hypothetical protein